MEGICSSGKTLGLHFRKILCEPWKDKEGKTGGKKINWVSYCHRKLN